MILRAIISRGWSPILITALAVTGYIYEWPIEILAPLLGIILIIGLIVAATGATERELEHSSSRLKQMAGYFSRRFAGDSSLSIFAIIDSLFKVDNPKLWDWARACDMSQRIFNTWCDSFISRLESDIRTRRFITYLRTYLNELWLINNHYHEFIEQFYEVSQKIGIPPETRDQYNRFVMEYNFFAQNFRDIIAELKKVAKTEIEPPSVKLAKELSETKPLKTTPEREERPQPTERKGYIM
jgi:hypothetical protein